MSFLANRLYNWVDNSTRDPVAEEKAKKEKDAIYELSKTYKTQLIQDNESLLNAQDTTYSFFDKSILTSLNKERQSLLDDTSGLSADEFKRKWTELSDKYKIVADHKSRTRFILYSYTLLIKQFNQDFKDMKPEFREMTTKTLAEIEKFLNDNKFTESGAVFDNFRTIVDPRFVKLLEDRPTAEAFQKAEFKLKKNKGYLDFEEANGPSVPDFVKENKEKDAKLEADKEQDTFDTGRLFTKILGYSVSVFLVLFGLFLLGIGSSFAVNLNIYKPVPFRILYAIYGCIFSIIVIPYTILYRWIYLGKPPKYYGFIPLIPRYFVHKPIQFLFGWLTYKPDNSIWDLEEWRHHAST